MRALSLPPLHPMSRLAGLVLRLGVGIIFIAHGWPKLQGGPANFAGFLTQLNVPLPEVTAWAVTLLELGGGVLLIVGLFTRVVALLFVIEMFFTTTLVKLDVGLVAPQAAGAGAEIDIAQGVGALAIALIGPGLLALDNVIGVEPKAVVARRA
jgi:putative oxidoreductase